MVNEQIFISYSRADNDRVSKINKKIVSKGYNTWMDTQNAYPGYNFEEFIPKAISDAKLFLIFLSNNRKSEGVFNRELHLIRQAYLKFQESEAIPRVIVILLDPVQETKIDLWLRGLTWIDYYKDSDAGDIMLFKALLLWAVHYKIMPRGLSLQAKDKLTQEPFSKKLLADFVVESLIAGFSKYENLLLGCGTTIYDLWYYRLRKYYLENGSAPSIKTISDFIVNHENQTRNLSLTYVPLEIVGNIHVPNYAAYKLEDPARDFPVFDAAIISVSGFELNDKEVGLKVCWDRLETTLKTLVNKIEKEIVIVAAGRKLFDPDGHHFVNIISCDINGNDRKRNRKLTIVVDNNIDKPDLRRFRKSLSLMNKHFGKCLTQPGIIYWQTKI